MKRPILALLILTLLASCGEQAPYTRTTQDGVEVLTYHRYAPPEVDPYRVEPGPVLGADQGMDTYLLSSARIAGTTPDGIFIVDDPREGRIHRFAPDGTHLDAFGRKGNGPGELGTFHFSNVDSSGLVVAAGQRALYFTFTGEYLDEIRPREDADVSYLAPVVSNPVPWQGGMGYASDTRRSFMPAPDQQETPYDVYLKVFDASFRVVHTIVDSTLMRRRYRLGTSFVASEPFAPDLIAAIAAWQPVAWNWRPASDRIDFLDTATMDRTAAVIPWSRRPLTRADREEVYARYDGEEREDARDRLPFPEELPPLSGMLWDGTGRLWVVHYQGAEAEAAGEPRRATVLDAEGRWLFDQHLPAVPDRIEGERFFLNTEDEEGQPVVEVYRLVER